MYENTFSGLCGCMKNSVTSGRTTFSSTTEPGIGFSKRPLSLMEKKRFEWRFEEMTKTNCGRYPARYMLQPA